MKLCFDKVYFPPHRSVCYTNNVDMKRIIFCVNCNITWFQFVLTQVTQAFMYIRVCMKNCGRNVRVCIEIRKWHWNRSMWGYLQRLMVSVFLTLESLNGIWAHFDLLLIWCLMLLQFYDKSILLQHHKSNKSKFIHSPAGWECRLDHLFVSNQPSNRICESKIIPNIYSAHSAVVLSISFSEYEPPRGPGFWKFNNSLLSDTKYVEKHQGTEDNRRPVSSVGRVRVPDRTNTEGLKTTEENMLSLQWHLQMVRYCSLLG